MATKMASEDRPLPVNVAVIPGAGMGHLMPISRFAASLSEICHVTMVSILPTVSSAESRCFSDFFSNYPQIHPVTFNIPPLDSSASPKTDPFLLRWDLVAKLAPDLLNHLLSNSSKPVSALVVDITTVSSILPLAKKLGIPCYVLFISNAAMLSFLSYFPIYHYSDPNHVSDADIPGLQTVPLAWFPLHLRDPNHFFAKLFIQNGQDLAKLDGVLVNTFDFIEPESLCWLRQGPVHVFSIGILKPTKTSLDYNQANGHHSTVFTWLDKQSEKSVLLVNFGSRSAMPREQIRQLGLGLEASGCRFLWVVKTAIVDKDDDTGVEELFGYGFLERVKERGIIIKGWVNQDEILGHKAIGGFLSHCGWNSVTEAAMNGVKILGWPRGGDQRISADVLARSKLGAWEKGWSWEGEEDIVNAVQISEKVKEIMNNETLTSTAKTIGEEATKAVEIGGSSYEALTAFVNKLKCSIKT